ncbi:DgyrCDS14258 [Dimorphilus gyrociliatus]|uniref:DgyrCDS14258 n=1 Tax=Dimorphilus gyrociliatus TaxID=2664684 RepID=A0A7I8WDA9_9ANNE|nr:DgyrCDS14258 [Dimorphilus gyrociliatus]
MDHFEASSASTDGAFCNLSEGALDRYRDSLEGASIASKITRFENFSSRSSPGRCPKTVRAAPPPTIPRPANLPPPNIYYETTVKKKPPPPPPQVDDDVLELDKVLKELQEFSAHLDKNIPADAKPKKEENSYTNGNHDSIFSEISSVTSSQESLILKMKEQRELRKKDEELHTKEQQRLDEIVHMFEEYRLNGNNGKAEISYITDEHDYDEVFSYEQEMTNNQNLQDIKNCNTSNTDSENQLNQKENLKGALKKTTTESEESSNGNGEIFLMSDSENLYKTVKSSPNQKVEKSTKKVSIELSKNKESNCKYSPKFLIKKYDENKPLKIIEEKQNRPLTRYLPVPDGEQFDLRYHLETSGHGLSADLAICVNKTSCQGWLYKLSESRPRRWQKRWFVLDRNKKRLAYYSSRPRSLLSSPRNSISFDLIEEVYVRCEPGQSSPGSAFCVRTKRRTLTLCAASSQLRAVWMDAVFLGGAHAYRFEE